MDLTIQTITIGSIIAVVGCLIAVLNFFAQRKNNHKDDEARLVRIETLLVSIEKNTNNLSEKVENHDHLLTKHESRLSVLESKLHHKGGK